MTQKKQVLCDLRGIFRLFNCQTPEKTKVMDRYFKSIDNIKELLEICDIMHVYDNTETPVRIIRKHKEDISIYPNEYWNEKDILRLIE